MNVRTIFVAAVLIAIPIIMYFVGKKKYFNIGTAVVTGIAIICLFAKGTFFAEVGAIVFGHIIALFFSILFLRTIAQDEGTIDNFLMILGISAYVIFFLMFTTAMYSEIIPEKNTSILVQETSIEEVQYKLDGDESFDYIENSNDTYND